MALVLGAYCVQADTVKLKDGTVLEGPITAENDTTLSIYIERSGGTITQTREINKTDIAQIIRWTPEQKATWQMNHDYDNLQRYQLNSNASYAVGYYDQIVDGIFRKFLTEHPDSSHVAGVTARIAEWKAERDLVAAGNIKFHGRWAPAAEAATQMEHERGQQLLQQARTLISHGDVEAAIQQLQPVLRMDSQPELVSQARSLLPSAYERAINTLSQEQQQLSTDVATTQQRVDQAHQALTQAEASRKQAMTSGQPLGVTEHDPATYQPIGAGTQPAYQAQTAIIKARSDLNAAMSHLDYAKSQLETVAHKLTVLRSQAASVTPATTTPQTAKSQPAPLPSANSPDVLAGLMTWVKKNWIGMTMIVLAIIFLITRFAKD
jgi:hypothetical protein